MTLTPKQKGKIARWLGFTAEPDDIAVITDRATILSSYEQVENDLDDLICQLEAIESRIWKQALVVPHVKMYFINIVEGWRLVQQISRLLGLPIRSGAELVWQNQLLVPLVPVASPAETPFVSLPARNFEYCELVECPIECNTPPKFPSTGQIWRDTAANLSWKWDGRWWRGISAGLNAWHENIAFQKTITLSASPTVTRAKGNTLPLLNNTNAEGYCIEQIRAAIAYDNSRNNLKSGSGITGLIAAGIVNTAETDGRSGRKLQANIDTFAKPGAQSPPTGVSTGITETWTDQIPPDVNNPDSIRTFGTTNTAVPGAYLVNGLQAIGTQVLNVDTGAIAPQAGTVFTIDTDQNFYTVLGGATTTSWPISPPLAVAAADNAAIIIRGSGGASSNNVRTNVSSAAAGAAGVITNAGGKTATINRNTRDQAALATSDYSFVSSPNDIYEYFWGDLSSFNNFGVEILSVGKESETCLITGRVNFSVSAIRSGI